MKKGVIGLIFIFSLMLVGCGSGKNEKAIGEKLKANGYNEIASSYIRHENDGSYIIINLNEKTIVYSSEKDDAQLEYNILDNTSWMYGCRYHYDSDTATNDGEGFGDCDDDTISFLKNSKSIIDDELSRLNISYDDLK